jgi:hypothetical protein
MMGLDSALVEEALPTTLARELEEELGLLPEHYQATRWKALEPYLDLEGARNHHALTQYRIVLFTVVLNPEGEFRIVRREAEPGENACLVLHRRPRVRGNTVEGHGAYIDAWKQSFGARFSEDLQDIRDSRIDRLSEKKGKHSTFPRIPMRASESAKTGKERSGTTWTYQHRRGNCCIFSPGTTSAFP